MGIAGLPSTEHFLLVGLLACVAAGLATSVGALPILFLRDISERLLDGLLGFAAGVMLAATSFSLIVPALADEHGGLRVTVAGMLIGAVFLASLDKFVPHFHFLTGQMHGPVTARLKKVWLFIIAITIHNLPEGLAVGVGFGAGDIAKGMVLATAIGLQNMPEGLAVALPLRREGYTRWSALWIATLSGLVEPVMGIVGLLAVSVAAPLVPWGMAFAAGAMLYVVSDEIIPESHRRGFEREATFGVIIGFCVMMILDNLLG